MFLTVGLAGHHVSQFRTEFMLSGRRWLAWGAGCNRLLTSIGELALGPLPCQLGLNYESGLR